MAYAHWEGYVITSARALLAYVSGLRLTYAELADSYVALCFAGKLLGADQSTRRIQRHIDVVTAMRQSSVQALFPSPVRVIHGEGNLKADKFHDIVLRLSLDAAPFELHYKWLDSELLRRRNNIAHGQVESIDADFARDALTTVGRLIDAFRTTAQNAAVLEVFKT